MVRHCMPCGSACQIVGESVHPEPAPVPAGTECHIVVRHCMLCGWLIETLGRLFTLSLLQRLHDMESRSEGAGTGHCGGR